MSATAPAYRGEPSDGGGDIMYVSYGGEQHLPLVMLLVDAQLSEPYSIFTYRYFVYPWPQLTFLAFDAEEGKYVGTVVCKMGWGASGGTSPCSLSSSLTEAEESVLCSACEAAEVRVLCCADEAALCPRCDRVHAANRFAGKHQRLPLLAPAASPVSPPPKCDICQECHAYFFCLEDRALLCRSCDVAVHTANAFVSAHRRFLLTGVQVGQEEDDHSPDQPEQSPPPPSKSDSAPLYGEGDFSWAAATPDATGVIGSLPDWSIVNEQFGSPAPRHTEATSWTPPKRSPRAPAFGGMIDWPLGEFFGGFSYFNGSFGFDESGTSKADNGKLGGSTDGSPYYTSASEDRNADELFGLVPEIQWSVPELSSPQTASGLHWQRRPAAHGASDSTAFVPDNSLRYCFPACQPATAKRRRKR